MASEQCEQCAAIPSMCAFTDEKIDIQQSSLYDDMPSQFARTVGILSVSGFAGMDFCDHSNLVMFKTAFLGTPCGLS